MRNSGVIKVLPFFLVVSEMYSQLASTVASDVITFAGAIAVADATRNLREFLMLESNYRRLPFLKFFK